MPKEPESTELPWEERFAQRLITPINVYIFGSTLVSNIMRDDVGLGFSWLIGGFVGVLWAYPAMKRPRPKARQVLCIGLVMGLLMATTADWLPSLLIPYLGEWWGDGLSFALLIVSILVGMQKLGNSAVANSLGLVLPPPRFSWFGALMLVMAGIWLLVWAFLWLVDYGAE